MIDRATPGKETEFKKPLRYLAEILKRRGVIVIISDFYDEAGQHHGGFEAAEGERKRHHRLSHHG